MTKALNILKNGVALMQGCIESNPMSVKELTSEIAIYQEAIDELLKPVLHKNCSNCLFSSNNNYDNLICDCIDSILEDEIVNETVSCTFWKDKI